MSSEHEVVKLQTELAAEIGRDAPHIATMVFGEAKDHPDVASVPNERLDAVYREKYQSNDRQWLQAEARRDPQQFMKVAQRIGAQIPPPQPPAPPMPAIPPAMPPALPVAPVPPPMPVAPAPMLPAAAPIPPVGPVAGAPVIYGPNGQPLISGA